MIQRIGKYRLCYSYLDEVQQGLFDEIRCQHWVHDSEEYCPYCGETNSVKTRGHRLPWPILSSLYVRPFEGLVRIPTWDDISDDMPDVKDNWILIPSVIITLVGLGWLLFLLSSSSPPPDPTPLSGIEIAGIFLLFVALSPILLIVVLGLGVFFMAMEISIGDVVFGVLCVPVLGVAYIVRFLLPLILFIVAVVVISLWDTGLVICRTVSLPVTAVRRWHHKFIRWRRSRKLAKRDYQLKKAEKIDTLIANQYELIHGYNEDLEEEDITVEDIRFCENGKFVARDLIKQYQATKLYIRIKRWHSLVRAIGSGMRGLSIEEYDFRMSLIKNEVQTEADHLELYLAGPVNKYHHMVVEHFRVLRKECSTILKTLYKYKLAARSEQQKGQNHEPFEFWKFERDRMYPDPEEAEFEYQKAYARMEFEAEQTVG